MQNEVETRPSFFRRHRILVITLSFFLLVFIYRFAAVYRYAPDRCDLRRRATYVRNVPKKPLGKQRETVALLTYNIQGHAELVRGDHIPKIAQAIRESGADVVGLNEVHRGTWQARFGDQLGELARLTGMSVAYSPSFSVFGGAYGNAVLTKGHIVNATVVDLPTIGEPRSMLVTRVDVGGAEIDFVVTHLAAWGGANAAVRETQFKCAMHRLQSPVRPTFVMGDFNASPMEEETRRSIPSTYRVITPMTATHKVTQKTWDYILATREVTVRSSRVLDIGPSDHRPVLAEVERTSLIEKGMMLAGARR